MWSILFVYSSIFNHFHIRVVLNFQIWPEKTNPEKYVFEDVAIATYLLVI